MKRLGIMNPFAAAIRANPDDDVVRLVCADWLDEVGESARAAFVRDQIACFPAPGPAAGPFLAAHVLDGVWPVEPQRYPLLSPAVGGFHITLDTRKGTCTVRFSRGFAAEVNCEAPGDFFRLAGRLGVAFPEARMVPRHVDLWLDRRAGGGSEWAFVRADFAALLCGPGIAAVMFGPGPGGQLRARARRCLTTLMTEYAVGRADASRYRTTTRNA